MKSTEASISQRDHVMQALRALEAGTLDPTKFPHAEHVRLGYEMVRRYPFGEAASRFSRGLKRVAGNAGKPQIYNETITIAFLAVINERRVAGTSKDWKQFERANPDLLQKRCLEEWYDAEQLRSDLARTTFCLPRPRAASSTPKPLP
ncbi:MAG: hypothetical protein ACJ8M4_02710 [Chthoniobacterales bacterium]